MKRVISALLCVLLLMQVLTIGVLVATASTVSNTVAFEDAFNYDAFNDGAWGVEYKLEGDANDYGYRDSTAPTFSNEAMKLNEGDGIRLDWQELPGFSFDKNKTYTFTFDVKITDIGDNQPIGNVSAWYRDFYFAVAGYWNLIEFKGDNTIGISVCGANGTTDSYASGTTYTCIIKWEPNSSKVSTEIKNGNTVVVSGERGFSEGGVDYCNSLNKYTRSFVWRCEDGAVEVDNITFTDGTNTYSENFNSVNNTVSNSLAAGAWCTEYEVDSDNDYGNRNSTTPSFVNGAMKLERGDGIRLDWQKLSGFAAFDTNKTYTITFDVKVTDFGNDIPFAGSPAWNREFYFAPAGYWNQIEFRSGGYSNSEQGIRAGDKTDTYTTGGWGNNTQPYAEDVVYSCTVVWKPSEKTFVSTVKNGNTIVSQGSRFGDDYATLNKYTRSFVWRCEDGSAEISNLTFTDGGDRYSEPFALMKNSVSASMSHTSIWGLEDVQRKSTLDPYFNNGVMTLAEKTGVRFNWTKVSGIGSFDPIKTYIFEFDTKLTLDDTATEWDGRDYTRTLYVGFGGWYNALEMPTWDNKIAVCGRESGSAVEDFDSEKYIGKKLHVSVEWDTKTITTTVKDEAGNTLISGSRIKDAFIDVGPQDIGNGVKDEIMKYLVIRCEDGTLEVDNFKFSTAFPNKVGSTTTLNITDGKQAVYECDINYSAGSKTAIKLGDVTIFSICDAGMIAGTKGVNGSFTTGTYKLKAYINPEQKLVSVEIVKPDGGVVRRGTYQMLGGNTVDAYSNKASNISNVKVSYADITVNEYSITQDEPMYSGVSANIYNIITSFNEAQTTRNFAWTAKTSFIGSGTMAVKYRVAGSAGSWTVVDAVKETERYEVADEDYFKCDVSGLTADTTYEYKIGKKGSTDETNDWTEAFTFKTAPNEIKNFSFIAIGDTQGITWSGDTTGDKGFKYTKISYDEAFEEMPNPAFVLHTGDVVEWGGNKDMWNWYFKSIGNHGATTPFFVTNGNHDTWMNAGENFYFDYHFNHPNNGGTAALDQSDIANITDASLKFVADNADETIFSYNYGNAHFVSINSGAFAHSQDCHIVNAQREWLEADLEANKDAEWIIVFQHQPVYHRLGGENDRDMLQGVLEKYEVDLVIQGHSHLVTRTYPIKNGQIATKTVTDTIKKGTGTIYTTIGSTALNHDGIDDGSNVEEMFLFTIPEMYQTAYTTVEIKNGDLTVVTKQANGLVLDTFTIDGEGEGGSDIPEDTTPEDTTPEATEPEATEPEATDPEATEPEATEPEATEPEATEPEATEPEATEPKTSETDKTPVSSETQNATEGTEDSEIVEEEEEGCGSSMAVTAVAVALTLSVFGITVVKKKDD